LTAEPKRLSLEEVGEEARRENSVLWATPSVRERVEADFGARCRPPDDPLPPETRVLVVIGGGTLMDRAKIDRARRWPGVRLILVPSIWGSGAESSPIAVNNEEGKKRFFIGDDYLPDAFAIWADLTASLPAETIRNACGDAWTHAYEAFVSPLASDEIRAQSAEILSRMLLLGLKRDADWFELSERACLVQARSAVGLVHGIAHVLELGAAGGGTGSWGHARLCSTFLLPVFELNRSRSPRWDELAAAHGLDAEGCVSTMRALFDPAAYRDAAPSLATRWPEVLRDPCTRTNSTLVRRGDLAHFTEFTAS
jgi:alcohol dehydrogenase class IV